MFRITGDSQGIEKMVNISPGDILGQFDIPPQDGTLPTDKMELTQVWKELFSTIASNEGLVGSGRYNMVGIFEHIARLMGAKDVDKFINQQPQGQPIPQPGVMADDQLENMVQQGNAVSIEEILGQVENGEV